MRLNQKGFSLVELIVVIAIMGVLSTVAIISLGLVNGQNVESCASDIESYIGQAKMQAMSRQETTLTIWVAENDGTLEDGIYVKMNMTDHKGDLVEGQPIKVGRSGVTVSYLPESGSEVVLSNTKKLILNFDRSSGAFKPLVSGGYCKEIRLDGGSEKQKIILIPQTGKYYIEDVVGAW